MASFFDEISKNKIKSIALMAIFMLFFMLIVFFIVILFGGGLVGLIIGAALIIGYAAFSYFHGYKFVLKIAGAKVASKDQYPMLYEIVDGLAAASQVKMPQIYIVNDNSPNAFATGRNKNNAYIVVTSGILKMMNREELEGVIAHEMSHIYNNDIQFMLIAVVFAGAIGLIAAVFRGFFFFGGLGGQGRNLGTIEIAAIVIGLLAPVFATLLRLAISRKREYMADANGARITRNPKSLASALLKIKNYTANPKTPPMKNVNEMTSSLYFSNPIKPGAFLSNLFSTHPPIDDRIKRLNEMY